MLKYILFLLCVSAPLAQATSTQFLFRDNMGKLHRIQPCFVDKLLRSIPAEKMDSAMEHIVIRPVQMDNGEYSLHAHVRGLGGGYWGGVAGCYVGKFAVHFIAHGTIAVISLCTGPAALVTAASLEATFLPLIEATSITVAIGVGIAGAVATGPV